MLIISILVIVQCLMSSVAPLPLTTSDAGSKNDYTNGRSPSTDAPQSLEELTQRKRILEEMLDDTNSKISKKTLLATSKRQDSKDVMTRFFSNNPNWLPKPDPPSTDKKRARGPSTRGIVTEPKPVEDLDKLALILSKLEEKEGKLRSGSSTSEPETTTTETPRSKYSQQTMSEALELFYKKLEDLDINIHELLGTKASEPSQATNGGRI